ncbi:hypothetical protein MLD38_011626 [Melastoma candidum]|uniref:Uncharacterized protein n=1 Tax=Melastoma candidum TaxID=119954 RepID=A0ACB9RC03_9MYRT|nr:hypothetical protein MLD38_011626 [Melastoma candidum]
MVRGDQRATSLSMASGDGVSNGKRKDENAIIMASDVLDLIRTTTHEEPIDSVSDVLLSGEPTIAILTDVSANQIGTLESIKGAPLSKERAEDNHVTLTCFPLALLQPTDGSVDSNQSASLAQVDSSHDVGVHSDSGDMINASSYLQSHSERAFDELDMTASAENANVSVAVAIDVGVKTESEKKTEMLDSVATYDNLICDMNILNAPKCVASAGHFFVSAEYEA